MPGSRTDPLINNFTGGEMSPLMEGRSDFNKYPHGCRRMENWIPLVHGGVAKRPGTMFVGSARNPEAGTRLLPFEFSATQAYVLEFGEQYMRPYFDEGPAVTVSANGLTTISKASPGQVGSVAHGMKPGDRVFISGITTGGMVELQNREFAISAVAANTYDLSELNPPRRITAITKANPAVVTSVAHGYVNSDEIVITDVQGMTEINSNGTASTSYIVTKINDDTFSIGVDTSGGGYTAYTKHGVCEKITNLDTSTYTAHNGSGTGNKILQFHTPYAHADVADLQYAQSADTIYLAHPDYAPNKITRTSNTAWTVTEIDFDYAPFAEDDKRSQRFDATGGWLLTPTGGAPNAYAPGATTVTVTASLGSGTGPFVATDVGRLLRVAVAPAEHYMTWESVRTVVQFQFIQYLDNVYSNRGGTTTGTTPPIHSDYGVAKFDGSGFGSPQGAQWQYRHSGVGVIRITSYSSPTVVGATIIHEWPTNNTTAVEAIFPIPVRAWSFGAWDETNGYPRAVTFYEDRLWWAGSSAQPQTFWASRTADYENHKVVKLDSGALSFTINDDQVNVIEWMKSRKFLIMGTSSEEWTVASSEGIRDAITAGKVRVDANTTEGSRAGVRPLAINDAVLFAQRDGRKLTELVFEFDQDQFVTVDRTRLSEHITIGKILDMAYQQEPWRLVWVITETGELLCMTYERREDVIAWHRHPVAGTDALVETIAVIPRTDGQGDQLWMVVVRTVDGGTVRHIEALTREWRSSDAIEDSKHMDSMLTYSGSSTTTINGLWHLEGETVSVLADGFVQADQVVTLGQVTLDDAATKVQLGLAYQPYLETLKIESAITANTTNSSQGKQSRVLDVVLRLFECGAGLKYGPDETNLDEVYLRSPSDLMDTPVPLYTGDTVRLTWKGGGDPTGERIALKHTLPLPCTIIAAMPRVKFEDR